MTQTIWLARHGNRIDFVQPEWFNTAKRRYDPHLSADGMIQAEQLGQRLAGSGIKHIFASPFLRTVQTANPLACKLGLSIKLEWGLGEWFNAKWMSEDPETLHPDHLAKTYPIDLTYQVPKYAHPETWEDCLNRTANTAIRLANEYPNQDLLLVGHGASVVGIARGLVGAIAEEKIQAPLCGIQKLVKHGDTWVLELVDDVEHLETRETAIRFV